MTARGLCCADRDRAAGRVQRSPLAQHAPSQRVAAHRRRRARPRLRLHPRRPLRSGRRRAAARVRARAARRLRRARRDRHLVADPARSRQPRPRRRASPPPSTPPSPPRSLGGARAVRTPRRSSISARPTRSRVQWRVLRDEKLAAARDGKRIKVALERAIALDPDLDDAYFGVGMYQVLRRRRAGDREVLRFLLRLPGGNRDRRPRADAAGADARPPAPG